MLDCSEDEQDLQQSISQQILLFTRMSWGTATHLDLNLTRSWNYQQDTDLNCVSKNPSKRVQRVQKKKKEQSERSTSKPR